MAETAAIVRPSVTKSVSRRRSRSSVASVVPVTFSTAICSGLPVHRGPAHPLAMGSKSRETHLRRIGPGGGGASDGSAQASRPARLRGVE